MRRKNGFLSNKEYIRFNELNKQSILNEAEREEFRILYERYECEVNKKVKYTFNRVN